MKKVFKHPRLHLLVVLLTTFFILVFLLNACHKQSMVEMNKSNDLISISKNYFENTVISKEKEMLSTPYSLLPRKAPARIFARMQKIDKLLEWDAAKQYTINGIKYVVTPINNDKTTINN
jgi:hypothetical protein